MNVKPSGRVRLQSSHFLQQVACGAVVAATLTAIGCGNTYRPVVSSINPVGPAGQPPKYAIAVSNPGAPNPGLITMVDVFGDSILVNANLGVNPYYFQIDSGGYTGYTLNGDGTLNSFSISTSLLTSSVLQSTLIPGSNPASIVSQGTYVYVSDAGRNSVAEMQGSPPALKQEIPTGTGTVYTITINGAPRVYTLAQQGGVTAGIATPIETSTNTPDAPITVGVKPVYGVMTADGRRVFVLNQGSNSVSVINAQTNALDTTPTIPVGKSPVWADFAPTLNELLVLNQGNGTTPGSVSIISIPLCNPDTVVTDPACSATNPVDANGFGTVIATVPVGINPIMIAVLQDGTQAFVANSGNSTTQGSVSVINLTTNTVTATLPAQTTGTTELDSVIHGHPNWIAATTGTPTGKVYVTAPDSNDLTIIRTDIDTVTSHLSLQGAGVAVRVTAP
jgi:YVTN family beta-propeller protein